jgi:hypothetical protein
MDDTSRAREAQADGPETTWALDDPKWHAYMMGWRAGFAACQQDTVDRLTPAAVDELLVKRLGEVLAADRARSDGIF